MRLGLFQGDAAEKGLSRIDPERVKRAEWSLL